MALAYLDAIDGGADPRAAEAAAEAVAVAQPRSNREIARNSRVETPDEENLRLLKHAVAEGLPKGTEVGTLLAQDPDAGDSHTFRITGGKDYKLFSIVDNKLLTKEVFDREVKDSLAVEVTVTDSGRLIAEVLFNITVIDVNDAPTDVTLDNDTIAENQPADSIVGNFTLVDHCLLYTSPSPRDATLSRMPSSA